MSAKKMGRPTDNPMPIRKGFRISEEDAKKLEYCVEHLEMSESEIIRKGIDMVYRSIKKES